MALSDEDKQQVADAILHALTEKNDREQAERLAKLADAVDKAGPPKK